MFASTAQRILLIFFVLLIVTIPIASYFISQRQQSISTNEASSDRSITTSKTATTKNPNISGAEQLKQASQKAAVSSPSAADDTNITIPVTFGPTLNFKIALEGRPNNNQSLRLFVGIAQGNPTSQPKYLLSFTVDVPKTGIFDGLSLAGLDSGNTYTAYLKGPSYVATSSAFIMNPAVSKLNNDEPLNLMAGDLNEDNTINSADFALAKNDFGAKTGDDNYNENIDINKDGRINSLDIGFIIKNFGKTGNSGVWISPVPVATSSGSPLTGSTSPPAAAGPAGGPGYWIWVPN